MFTDRTADKFPSNYSDFQGGVAICEEDLELTTATAPPSPSTPPFPEPEAQMRCEAGIVNQISFADHFWELPKQSSGGQRGGCTTPDLAGFHTNQSLLSSGEPNDSTPFTIRQSNSPAPLASFPIEKADDMETNRTSAREGANRVIEKSQRPDRLDIWQSGQSKTSQATHLATLQSECSQTRRSLAAGVIRARRTASAESAPYRKSGSKLSGTPNSTTPGDKSHYEQQLLSLQNFFKNTALPQPQATAAPAFDSYHPEDTVQAQDLEEMDI